MTPDATTFESDIRSLVALGDLDGALAFIRFLVDHVRFDPAAVGIALGSPALDRLCAEIGALTLPEARQRAAARVMHDHPDVIILATELYALGGHSRVIGDLIAAQPGKRHLILLSNFFDTADGAAAESMAAGTRVQIAQAGGRLDKLLWLQTELACHSDAQVFVFNHHGDAAAIAAIQPGLNREVSFCHHADYHLCLGTHLRWVRHVDFFAPCQHRCAEAGIAAEYWPLSVADGGARPHDAQSFGHGATLTTCSSGVWSKFDEAYPLHYADVIGDVLRASGGRHVHIGGIPPEGLARIHASLVANGVDTQRFEHIVQVPSLWAALLDKRVDLYIGSFPFGGGRATAEALGAGIPLITHRHQLDAQLGAWGIAPEDTWSWSSLHELTDILARVTRATLAERSVAAREFYLRYHRPDVFARCVQTGHPVALPTRAPHETDRLLSYLLRSAVRKESHAPVIEELHKRLEAIRAAANAPTQSMQTSHTTVSTLAHAIALYDAGNLEAAGAALTDLHGRQPKEPQVLVYLGLIALRSHMPDDAAVFFEHAANISQDAANTLAAIGQRCLELGETSQGIQYLEGAIAKNKSLVGAYALLADALQSQGEAQRALALLKPLLQQGRELHPEILLRMVRLAAITGDTETELAACRNSRQHAEYHSRLLKLLSERADTTAAALLDEARQFVAAHANQPRSTLPTGPRARLRIGFVLGVIDARERMQQLESLLCELDSDRFESLLFFDQILDMPQAQRFALIVDESHAFTSMDVASTAQLIQARQTDILISLEWHAHFPALMIFAQRAAPVQINYSYPARSSALANMDYVLSATEGSYSERLLLLPDNEDAARYAEDFGAQLLSAWQQAGGTPGGAA